MKNADWLDVVAGPIRLGWFDQDELIGNLRLRPKNESCESASAAPHYTLRHTEWHARCCASEQDSSHAAIPLQCAGRAFGREWSKLTILPASNGAWCSPEGETKASFVGSLPYLWGEAPGRMWSEHRPAPHRAAPRPPPGDLGKI